LRNKVRLEKLEEIMGYKDRKVYVIDPFGEEGEEVVVTGGNDEHKRISIEEYEALNTDNHKTITLEYI